MTDEKPEVASRVLPGPPVDIGGPVPAEPRSKSVFKVCLASFGTALRSGTSLRRQVVLDWLRSLKPEADFSSLSIKGAEDELLDLVSERMRANDEVRRMNAGCDARWLDAEVRRNVLMLRTFAWWMVLWTVLLPLGAVAAVLVFWVPEKWSIYDKVATAAVGYIICTPIALFVQGVLVHPFAWLAGRLLGAPLQMVKEPEEASSGRP